MSSSLYLCERNRVRNFDFVYQGPGVYVLYDGPVAADDRNIVYIGKSARDVLMRVATHSRDKDFDRVGVILPARTDPDHIHNLEHLVIAEYVERMRMLPPYNQQRPKMLPGFRHFNWHTMRRRPEARFV